MEGVDYAWARPNLDQLWAAGKRFVCRYLAQLPNGKVLSNSERAVLHAKGFDIVLNWEQAAGDMLRGSDVGASHAREALRQANALGAPASAAIYFSCDVDTVAAQRPSVAAYLDGAASVLGRARVGVYGEYDVIEAMVPQHAAWGWQTYAWSGGRVSSKAHLLQYHNGVRVAGADCDLDRSLTSKFGQWPAREGIDEVTKEEIDEIVYRVSTIVLAGIQPAGYADQTAPEPYRGQLQQAVKFTGQALADAFTKQIAAQVDVKALAAELIAGGLTVTGGLTQDEVQTALITVLKSEAGQNLLVRAVNTAEDS